MFYFADSILHEFELIIYIYNKTWTWIFESFLQIKLGSLKLVRVYMNRVVSAFKCGQFLDDEDLILNGVRFAFRVHQVCSISS